MPEAGTESMGKVRQCSRNHTYEYTLIYFFQLSGMFAVFHVEYVQVKGYEVLPCFRLFPPFYSIFSPFCFNPVQEKPRIHAFKRK